MLSSRKQDQKICETALRLAAFRGWEHVTLPGITAAAKISNARIKKQFTHVRDILPLLVGYITVQALKNCEKPKALTPVRDRVFEIMMARFDALQHHRKAILSIASYALRDTATAMILLRAQKKAVIEMLRHAGITATKKNDLCVALGFYGIFILTFKTWRLDETLDMSKTMASLDRNLRFADRLAILLRTNLT